MPDTPSAPDLSRRLDELTGSINGLRKAVDDERSVRVHEIDVTKRKFETAQRARKRSNLALGVAVAAALLGALVSMWLAVRSMRETDAREHDRVHAAVVACENSNVTRQAIEDRFGSLIDLLASAGQPAATPEAAATRKAAVVKFRADFAAARPASLAPRYCSEAAVSSPAPIAR